MSKLVKMADGKDINETFDFDGSISIGQERFMGRIDLTPVGVLVLRVLDEESFWAI